MKFCTMIGLPDIVTRAKLDGDRFGHFLVVGARISGFPIDFGSRSYNTQSSIILSANTGRNYQWSSPHEFLCLDEASTLQGDVCKVFGPTCLYLDSLPSQLHLLGSSTSTGPVALCISCLSFWCWHRLLSYLVSRDVHVAVVWFKYVLLIPLSLTPTPSP